MEQSVAPVQPGDIIAGKYRIERILGMGGMGVVVAAINVKLDQRVALKFLLPNAVQSPEIVARFEREARAAVKIQSEHVARVLDVDTLPNGSPYMVMEFMDGEDLEQVLARRGPLPMELAVSYVLQACEALAEAHAMGIVHRNLKPSNLFLCRRPGGEPTVKVLDFGISKAVQSTSQAALTKTSALIGSPLYMSPEQMASAKHVDVRSDIWAMGIVLYQLLTGRTPFPAESMPEFIVAVVQRPPDPIQVTRPDLPNDFVAAIERCLEKDPASRFPNVAALAAAIGSYGPPQGSSSLDRISRVLGAAPAHDSAAPPRGVGARPGGTAVLSHAGARTDAPVVIAPVAETPRLALVSTGPRSAEFEPSVVSSGRRRTPFLVAAGGGALLAVGLLVTLLHHGSSAVAATGAAGLLETAPSQAPPPPVVPDPPPTPVADPVASTPLPAVPTSAHESRSAAGGSKHASSAPHSAASVAPTPTSPVVPSTPSRPAAKPAVDCTMPFTIDAQGHRVPKPECS